MNERIKADNKTAFIYLFIYFRLELYDISQVLQC